MSTKGRGIPRLIKTSRSEKDSTGVPKSRERNSSDNTSPTDPVNEKSRAFKFKPAARAKHFIQGPFNPNIVGLRERRADDKRKRNDSDAKILSTQFLSNVEDPRSTKRNPSGEEKRLKTKCKIEFNSQIDTAFGIESNGTEGHPLQFTAKGHVSPRRSQRLLDTKKSEDKRASQAPPKRTIHKPVAVEKLTTQLDTANERVKLLEEELESLKKQLSEKDATYSDAIETQAHSYSKQNRELQQQLEQCMQKLQQCDIDPVTLKSLDPDDEEKENLEIKRQQSVEMANKLRTQLQKMNEQSVKAIAGLKVMLAEASDVQVVPSSPKNEITASS